MSEKEAINILNGNNKRKKYNFHFNRKTIIVSICSIIIALIVTGIFSYKNYVLEQYQQIIENKNYETALKYYKNMFDDEKDILSSDLTIDLVKKCKSYIQKLTTKNKKEKLLNNVRKIEKYVKLRDDINNLYNENIMKSTVTEQDIEKITNRYEKLNPKYQKLLTDKIEDIKLQRTEIDNLIKLVNGLFNDENYQEVKNDINKDNYNIVLDQYNKLKQIDIKNQYLPYLQKVDQEIKKREEEAKRQRELEIANAWVKINVPYVSQNKPKVYNGCEAASLLMALKHKGYLGNMDLVTYATNMPKSNDPHQGFVYDIFSLEPRDKVHWIAPDALTSFGISSSGYNNVVNSSGFSLDQLDNELNNDNLIVIYLTGSLKKPKNWQGEVPGNLHVLLLSGYNKITGEHIITDPWTKKDGSYEWNISKNDLESIYNAVGKKSVVVR